MKHIQVQFTKPGQSYTYIAEDDVEVGDYVLVPTKHMPTGSVALVMALNRGRYRGPLKVAFQKLTRDEAGDYGFDPSLDDMGEEDYEMPDEGSAMMSSDD